ncbi:MAG: hypothetical protein IJ958_05745 [Agathobacter sp.]|nr:hypothetical protein [Agathobacter sp.]
MFDKREVHEFANKYYNLYANPETLEYQVGERFADKCFELNFKMDCGEAIERAFPNMRVTDDASTFFRVVKQIDDIGLLGSAIFSKYRYITHWAYCDSLLSKENREWFKMAFERLIELTEETEFSDLNDSDIPERYLPCFSGRLEKIHLKSDGTCYGPCPNPEDEIEQSLTIRRDGRVWFYGFNFGGFDVEHTIGRRIQYKMPIEKVNNIFDSFTKTFSKPQNVLYATDIGSWDLKLTNVAGYEYAYGGSMLGKVGCDGVDLTKLLQEELDIEDVWGFGYNEDEIE